MLPLNGVALFEEVTGGGLATMRMTRSLWYASAISSVAKEA